MKAVEVPQRPGTWNDRKATIASGNTAELRGRAAFAALNPGNQACVIARLKAQLESAARGYKTCLGPRMDMQKISSDDPDRAEYERQSDTAQTLLTHIKRGGRNIHCIKCLQPVSHEQLTMSMTSGPLIRCQQCNDDLRRVVRRVGLL